MTYQREFTNRVRIGLIGAGGHVYRNILPTLTYLPVELVAICDLDIDRARVTSKQYGVARAYSDAASMLSDGGLDAVVMAVSAKMHPILASLAFDAGLHVWMEKPPAMRVQDIEQLIGRRNDRVCVVGFKKAFMPASKKARDYFGNPANGPVSSLSADYPVTLPQNGPAVLRDGQATNWLANGCHPLSMMLAVCGPVAAATAHVNASGEGALVMEFVSGAIGTLNLVAGAGSSAPIERYRFHGRGCTLSIDNGWTVTIHRGDPGYRYGATQSYLGDAPGALVWEPQNAFATLENMATFTQGMFFELSHFCEAILQHKQATEGTLEFAVDVMRIYEAALLSEGKRVAV